MKKIRWINIALVLVFTIIFQILVSSNDVKASKEVHVDVDTDSYGFDDESYSSSKYIYGNFKKGEYIVKIKLANGVTTVKLVSLHGFTTDNKYRETGAGIRQEDDGLYLVYSINVEYEFKQMEVFVMDGYLPNGDWFNDDTFVSDFIIIIPDTDETAPTISGYQWVYYTSVDNPKSLIEILDNVRAEDETDGEVEVHISNNNYTGYEYVIGSHFVTLYAEDKEGNKEEVTIDIRVIDNIAPTITGNSKLISYMSNPLIELAIRNELTVCDNYDTDIVITMIEDGFTGHEQEMGEFYIKYVAIDNSSNKSEEFIMQIITKDDIKPIISGINSITISNKETLDYENIISQLEVSDNISQNIKLEIELDEYENSNNVVGEYRIGFTATDEANNTSEVYVVNVIIKDKIPPVFWVSEDFFTVDSALSLTHEQIVKILLSMNDIDIEEMKSYSVIEDTYTSNKNVSGMYSVSYEIVLKNDTVIQLNSDIKVGGKNDNDNYHKDNYKVSFWAKLKNFFANLGKTIVRYLLFGFLWDKNNYFKPTW